MCLYEKVIEDPLDLSLNVMREEVPQLKSIMNIYRCQHYFIKPWMQDMIAKRYKKKNIKRNISQSYACRIKYPSCINTKQ